MLSPGGECDSVICIGENNGPGSAAELEHHTNLCRWLVPAEPIRHAGVGKCRDDRIADRCRSPSPSAKKPSVNVLAHHDCYRDRPARQLAVYGPAPCRNFFLSGSMLRGESRRRLQEPGCHRNCSSQMVLRQGRRQEIGGDCNPASGRAQRGSDTDHVPSGVRVQQDSPAKITDL